MCIYCDLTVKFVYLYLSLLSRVLDGLEDVPRVSPPHLRSGHILTIPSLNQDGRSDGWRGARQMVRNHHTFGNNMSYTGADNNIYDIRL